MFKILLAAGGTGGHIYPAIAVADAIKARRQSATIEFIGAVGGMEEWIVSESGYKINLLPVSGFYRQLNFHNLFRNLSFPVKLIRSLLIARQIVHRFQPNWVVGFGGYASYPAVRVGLQLGCRTAIMEQNAHPGLANRRLAPFVDVVFLGNEAAAPLLKNPKVYITGNPVRASIGTVSKSQARNFLGLPIDSFVLLVLGGSLGAKAINNALEASLGALLDSGVETLWQCGRLYYDALRSRLPARAGLHLFPFIDRMEWALAAADLALCRSGALTLAELEQACLPALLVPSPNVADDHQTQNAQAYAHHGGAIVIPEVQLLSTIVQSVLELMNEPSRLQTMRECLFRLPKRDSAALIADFLLRE